MKPPEFYRGREQTYIKHFILEKYLERVAYNILSFQKEFVYVDGFSGPWQSEDEVFEDTSFVIALNQLRKVRDGYLARGREVKIRCLFNDNDPDAYKALASAVNGVEDIEIKVLCKDFEEVVTDIVDYVGRSFSLTFIDPTGWKGFGLEKISSLFSLPGEVLINFMLDFVRRFIDDPRAEIAASFDPIFGGPGWHLEVEGLMTAGYSLEDAILEIYRERLRGFANFKHITSTRVLKPLSDRSYFHLVYGTRHWKGLVEFRSVEKKTVEEQEQVRDAAKFTDRQERTGQQELFGAGSSQVGPRTNEAERRKQLDAGYAKLQYVLKMRQTMKYEELLGTLLELPLVWQGDLNEWLNEMRKRGEIHVPDLQGRERTPKIGYVIRWNG